MPITLSDLARAFDALGWRYQTIPDRDLLLTGFHTEIGSANLALRPALDGQAVLLEAVGLGQAPAEQMGELLALAWQWPGIAVARDPQDGEVRLRLLLPVGQAALSPEALGIAVGTLVSAVEALRQTLSRGAEEPGSRGAGEQRSQGAGEPGRRKGADEGAAGPEAGEAEEGAEAPAEIAAALQRAQALLEGLAQADDQAAYLRAHLDEFDEEVLAALTAAAQAAQAQGEEAFAQGLAGVVAAALALRLERDPAAQRLQRLLEAPDEAALAALADQWSEALGSDVGQRLAALAQAAQQAGQGAMARQAESVRERLQALRAARPLDAALADFLDAETWEAGRAVVAASPPLQSEAAVARLRELARRAQERGEEQTAARYTTHARHLAQWLSGKSEAELAAELERHPLWQLAARVAVGEEDLAQAIEEALQPDVVNALDEATLDALDDRVPSLALRDRRLAYALARLNDAVASRVAGPRVQAHCALRVGQLAWQMGNGALALERLQAGLALYDQVGDRLGKANVLQAQGDVLYFLKRTDEALQKYEAALALYDQVGDRIGQINTHLSRARLWRGQGTGFQDAAYDAYRQALELVEAIRGLQRQESFRREWMARTSALYTEMVFFCLELGRHAEAWHWAERGKGRTLLDLLGSARPRLDSPEKRVTYEEWQRLQQESFRLEAELDRLRRGGNGHGPARGAPAGPQPLPAEPQADAIRRLEAELARAREKEQRLRRQVARLLEEGRELVQVDVPPADELALALQELTCSPHLPPSSPSLSQTWEREGGRGVGEGSRAQYLALAARLNAEFYTADRKLFHRCQQLGVLFVKMVE